MSANLTVISGDGTSPHRNGMERLTSALDVAKDEVGEKIRKCCKDNVIDIGAAFTAMTCHEKEEAIGKILGDNWDQPVYSFSHISEAQETASQETEIGVTAAQIFTGPDIDLGMPF